MCTRFKPNTVKLKLSDFDEFTHGDKVIVGEMDRQHWWVHSFLKQLPFSNTPFKRADENPVSVEAPNQLATPNSSSDNLLPQHSRHHQQPMEKKTKHDRGCLVTEETQSDAADRASGGEEASICSSPPNSDCGGLVHPSSQAPLLFMRH